MAACVAQRKHVSLPTDFRLLPENGPYGKVCPECMDLG